MGKGSKVLRLLSMIFGFILILMGLWCIIFTFIVIFNLLPCFDKFSEFVKGYIVFPFNIGKGGVVAMDWDGIKHLTILDKIVKSAFAIFFGIMIAVGGLVFIGKFGVKNN